MENLTIKGELLFEFNSFSQWVNKASSWFKPYKYGFSYAWIRIIMFVILAKT